MILLVSPWQEQEAEIVRNLSFSSSSRRFPQASQTQLPVKVALDVVFLNEGIRARQKDFIVNFFEDVLGKSALFLDMALAFKIKKNLLKPMFRRESHIQDTVFFEAEARVFPKVEIKVFFPVSALLIIFQASGCSGRNDID